MSPDPSQVPLYVELVPGQDDLLRLVVLALVVGLAVVAFGVGVVAVAVSGRR
jgi:hypothetical protein